jgi:hypothetical protein
MSAVTISIVVGIASLACVALSWRTPITRHVVLTLAGLVNLGLGQLLSAQSDQARWVSLSVAGTLIVVAILRSKREHWRGPTLFLWGLVLVFLAASYFLMDAPAILQRGLLIALSATTGLAILSSLILLRRLMRADTSQRA